VAGAVCYGAVLLKWRLGYDDSLDAVGVHGAGGVTGALLTGIFASKAVNSLGADGLLYGNAAQLGVQVVAVVVTAAFSFAVSFAILKLVDATVGLRVDVEEESTGLDLSQHSETGYAIR
jgi:Amt family ammonium transporter